MAEIRSARIQDAMRSRLTLFPPSGKRIHLDVKIYDYDGAVLHYTDMDGIECETTLRYAIEHVPDGYEKNRFLEGSI